MQSFTPDPSGVWVISYRERERTTVIDRIAGWVICTHDDHPEIHPVVIYDGRALCAETAAQQYKWNSWEILPDRDKW
jgi:hypothetical protein